VTTLRRAARILTTLAAQEGQHGSGNGGTGRLHQPRAVAWLVANNRTASSVCVAPGQQRLMVDALPGTPLASASQTAGSPRQVGLGAPSSRSW